MSKKTCFDITSDSDSLRLSCMIIEPEDARDIRGVVQILHGMCEYKERYEHFMNYLSDNGYLVIIHDHRGHGKSIVEADDLGFMYEGGYKALISDAHQVTKYAKEYVRWLKPEEKLPFILIGHSMGSLVARCYLKKYDNEIDKMLILGCPSKLPNVRLGLVAVKIIGLLKGAKGHSKLLDNMSINSNYEKRFESEQLAHAWLNSSRDKVLEYNLDSKCNFFFTINGYENLTRLVMDTYSKAGYKRSNKNMPIWFLSGADDPCAISKKHLHKAMDCIKKAGYTDVRGKMYDGMRHEILHEPKREKVYGDILEFIASSK